MFQAEGGLRGRGLAPRFPASVLALGAGGWCGPQQEHLPSAQSRLSRWFRWWRAQGLVPTSPAGCYRLSQSSFTWWSQGPVTPCVPPSERGS